MKLGVITDIHNNLTALKAIMEKLNKLNCDKIICCGDIIGIGPCPEETVQFMMQIPNLIAVCGNHEKYLIQGMPDKYPNEENMDYEEMKHHKWEHNLLSAKSIKFLKSLPYKKDIIIEDFKISIMHYCMNDNGNYINYKTTPCENDLKTMFENIDSDIILYGHNHCRNICNADKLYINFGSLGCPAQDKNLARAGILNINNKNIDIQTLDIEYDIKSVIKMIDKIKYPDTNNIKKYFYGI